ncbi:hypothetical protein C440_01220 [Haloferax mucosum ATCC BAA-1512]|uniref:Uncharacterized protein n=1 Tax=Haloferax mucosum ATCC BAA-1512 TaxID=662479 RepID=M0ITX8_9EURY|nr:SipW-dependent-type signal peptide-containing protein [Haloferax mucosum]ELZ98934.1 hypothetical protein C440_01220 [Haloferax mucosum ATCC BAA-1512]
MTDDNTIELSRRKVLGGLALIGVASATAGAGTIAALNDTENSNGNQIYAGRMDLRIDGGDSSVTLIDTGSNSIVPGDSGIGCVTLTNSNGSNVAGAVDVRITRVADSENGREEMEKEAGDTTGAGELGEHLLVRMYFEDGSGNRTYLGDDQYRKATNRLQSGKTFNTHYPLDVSGEVDFCLDWKLPSSAPPTIQTDSFEVDFAFDMMQAVLGDVIDGQSGFAFTTSGKYTGYPVWNGSETFKGKMIRGDTADSTAESVQVDGTGAYRTWDIDGSPAGFAFETDGDTASLDVDGTGTGVIDVADTTSGVIALVLKSGDVTVENLAIDGIPVAPGSLSIDSGGETLGIQLDVGSFDSGVTVTGDITLGSTDLADETGVEILVQ